MPKIRLTETLPLEKKHGATKGRVFECIESTGPARKSAAKFWFIGDAGVNCAAFGSECELIEDEGEAVQ